MFFLLAIFESSQGFFFRERVPAWPTPADVLGDPVVASQLLLPKLSD
jgi:hypothetical protein